MVMSARAGTSLAQIEDALAARRQMLAFEPIELAALGGGEAGEGTIAGVFATNLSGPRRIRRWRGARSSAWRACGQR